MTLLLHSHLNSFIYNLAFWKAEKVHWRLDHTDGVNKVLPGLLQCRALRECPWDIFRPGCPPLAVFYKVCSDLHCTILLYAVEVVAIRDHLTHFSPSVASPLVSKFGEYFLEFTVQTRRFGIQLC